MEILLNFLYKIDIEAQNVSTASFSDATNLDSYILELLQTVIEEDGDREYEFEEGSISMLSYLTNILNNSNIEETTENIAIRLMAKETDVQDKMLHLNTKIPKGILIISYVKMTSNESKIIISKADYNEFLEEISGNITTGLPLEKKIYKVFIANIHDSDNCKNITSLFTYDKNTRPATYWWKDFLELVVVRDDDENTKNAFNSIERYILKPIKKKHPQDFLYLWNATIAYFRGDGNFCIDHYSDEIIGSYQPFDETLSISVLQSKTKELPQKNNFDKRFVKVPKVVTKKFKQTLKLTGEIDLILKHDMANIASTIRTHKDVEGEYIMIRSSEGYKYAVGLKNKEQNEKLSRE